MVGNDFFYDGHWLSEFGMMIYDPEESQQFVGREIERSEITSIRPVPNHYSAHFTNTLELSCLIVKNQDECMTQEDTIMEGMDISCVRLWLERPKIPTLFYLQVSEDVLTTNYFGLFTDIQPFMVGGNCYGLYLKFTCNAPYGFSDLIKKEFDISQNTVTLCTFSNHYWDYGECARPTIKIKSNNVFSSNESIKIENLSDDNRYMLVKLPSGLSSITIDCDKKKIISPNGNILPLSSIGISIPISGDYNFISSDMYSFNWFRLLSTINKLKFTCDGNVTIETVEMSTRYIIKSGGI